jgi:hypothetical protein
MSFFQWKKFWSRNSVPQRRRSRTPQSLRLGCEPLESRQMLTLLGVGTSIPLALPLITFDSNGSVAYTASTDAFDVAGGRPLKFLNNSGLHSITAVPNSFNMHILVDHSGNLIGGTPGNDLEIDGSVSPDGVNTVSGVLLTGEVTGFGYLENGTTDQYDFRFRPTGGALSSYWAGNDIGITIGSENSTFNDDFTVDFTGGDKGTVGNIPRPTPSLVTSASEVGNVVGSAVLSDSATITGGNNPTGSIVFTLTAPDNTTSTVATVPVSGDGTYSSPTVTATEVGIYTWHASYGGDSLNNGAVDDGTNESVTTIKASPAISTQASEVGNVVGSAILSDSATITGGDSPSGTITFTLTAPDNTTSTVGTVPVSGDGTYNSPSVTATQVGTYTWHASYSGDGLNNGAVDNGAVDILGINPVRPIISFDSGGHVSYTASTDAFDVGGGRPLAFLNVSGPPHPITAVPNSFIMHILVDHSGNLIGGTPGNDLEIDGSVSPDGVNTVSGVLLTGEVTDFGALEGGTTDQYFFRFTPTGGALSSYWAGNDIGITMNSENSTFNNDFTVDFGGGAKGNAGNIGESVTTVKASPAISTQASEVGNVVGSAMLNDSATITGGYNVSGGSITFTLTAPDSSTSTVGTVPVSGAGTYNAPSVTATEVGTYTWHASYSGDGLNNGAIDNGTNESVTTVPASPAISTSASETDDGVVGSAMLNDSATISGGYNVSSGTITFTLTAPDNSVSTVGTVPVNGAGTYNAPSVTATQVGTYTWHASYSGDGLNNGAIDNGANESVTTVPASPAISTSASAPDNVVGSAILSDSATISGGFNVTSGTITFTLTAPDNSVSTVGTVPVNGPGTYFAPTVLATQVGTYTWHASYSGDGLNSGAIDNGANETETTVKASPAISTQASEVGNVVGSAMLNDSATITGGYNVSGGSITFTLTAPDSSTSTVGTVPVSGAGTYNAPSVTATEVGTYTWHASYSGDDLNNGAIDNGVNESVTTVKASPAISTYASETAGGVVGVAMLNDSATISGGDSPSGSITFTLTAPDNSTSTVGTVPVSGAGTYNAPAVTATQVGTYTWHASYSGNGLNNGAVDNGVNESVTTVKASPAISTSASETASGVVGVAMLNDSATISGGDSPTGTITFTLTAPNNSTSTVGTVAVSGAGTYNAPTVTATQVGTYTWHASYSGNGLNNGAVDNGVNESVTTVKASPTLITTASFSAGNVVGSAIPQDKAVLSGGYHESGTITFKLTAPNNTVVDTETFTPSGDGTFNTSNTHVAAQVGTYTWTVSYAGDALNNGTHDQGGAAEQVTTVKASPVLFTFASFTTSTNGMVAAGQFATIGFWQNKNGQAVINSFNGSTTSTALGNWMATTFPHLFGASNPYTGTSLAGLTNAQIAAVYSNLWTPSGVTKNTYVQAFAVALGIYSDTTSLGGASLISNGLAAKYGFNVTAAGAGSYNVGSNGAAFGVANNTVLSVMNIMQIVDANFTSSTGLFFAGDQTKTSAANNVLNGINTNGDIGKCAQTQTQANSGADVLNDSATLSGGYNITGGTITFTLTQPNNSTITVGTVAVTGPGTYTSPTVLATQVGTYTWHATYTGDTLNNGAVDNGTNESLTTGSPGAISGTKYLDVTGNGMTSDDTPFAGVRIYLDLNNDSVWESSEPSQITGADGTYAFTGLAAGTYTVREVNPTGYVRTGPTLSDNYSITLAAGATSSGNNFDDAATCNLSEVSNIVYVINGMTPVTDLRGNTHEGDTVEVSFTYNGAEGPHRFTLVSYTAPGPTYDATQASLQQIFDVDTGVFGAGNYTLTVTIPHTFYQVDFVCGSAIDHFGPSGSNIFYGNQGRLFSADNSGTHVGAKPAGSLTGSVYLDANNNGVIDSGERSVAGVTVTLAGTLSGGGTTTQTVLTDTYGVYTFDNLAAGTYTITETTPITYTDGKDTLGNKGGTVSNDKFSGIVLAAGAQGTSYNFGEQQVVGAAFAANQTGSSAFWNGTSGQALIKALNGGSSATNLGKWLATTFNNMFGANAGTANNLSGKTNAQVAAYFQTLYANSAKKLEAESMALALSVYVTNSGLAGTTASSYGFAVSANGLGASTVNVGSNGAAFGVSNNAVMTVTELLQRANARARNGLLWDINGDGTLSAAETSMRNMGYSLFTTINNT